VNREVFWVVFWPRPCRRLQILSLFGDSATSHRRTPTARLVSMFLGGSTLWDLAKKSRRRGFMDASVGSHAGGTVNKELLNTGRTVE
jgi:hypothetical protein